MSKIQSEIGTAVRRVIDSMPKVSGDNMPPLHGWQQVTEDLPSLGDMQRVYTEYRTLVQADVPTTLTAIAASMSEFRGMQLFVDDGNTCVAILFYRPVGSFLYVFGIDAPSVRLYCMGLAWTTEETHAKERMAHCSRMTSDFEDTLETAYLNLRDERVGKYGIPPKSAEDEWEPCWKHGL